MFSWTDVRKVRRPHIETKLPSGWGPVLVKPCLGSGQLLLAAPSPGESTSQPSGSELQNQPLPGLPIACLPTITRLSGRIRTAGMVHIVVVLLIWIFLGIFTFMMWLNHSKATEINFTLGTSLCHKGPQGDPEWRAEGTCKKIRYETTAYLRRENPRRIL